GLIDVDFVKQTFYFIDFETILDYGLASHIPVEIAVIAWSVERGELRIFHKFIDPGHIPAPYVTVHHYLSHSEATLLEYVTRSTCTAFKRQSSPKRKKLTLRSGNNSSSF